MVWRQDVHGFQVEAAPTRKNGDLDALVQKHPRTDGESLARWIERLHDETDQSQGARDSIFVKVNPRYDSESLSSYFLRLSKRYEPLELPRSDAAPVKSKADIAYEEMLLGISKLHQGPTQDTEVAK